MQSVPFYAQEKRNDSLGLDFAVLLDMDVVVGLEDSDFVIGEFHAGQVSTVSENGWKCVREALDQCELMLDLSSIGLGLLFCLVQFVGWSVFFESDLPLSVSPKVLMALLTL
jgi:hypothetical protein